MDVHSRRTGSVLHTSDGKAFASFDNHTLTVDFKRLGAATAAMDGLRGELTAATQQMRNATASAQGEAQCLKDKVAGLEARLELNELALQRQQVAAQDKYFELANIDPKGVVWDVVNTTLVILTAAALVWFAWRTFNG